MSDNERLQQIIQKLNELETLRNELDLGKCDEALTTEADQKAWNLYLHLRQPGVQRTASRRIARAYECLDEGFVDLAASSSSSAYEMNQAAARRIALLLPDLAEALAKLNVYPMENSEIAQKYWREQDERG